MCYLKRVNSKYEELGHDRNTCVTCFPRLRLSFDGICNLVSPCSSLTLWRGLRVCKETFAPVPWLSPSREVCGCPSLGACWDHAGLESFSTTRSKMMLGPAAPTSHRSTYLIIWCPSPHLPKKVSLGKHRSSDATWWI